MYGWLLSPNDLRDNVQHLPPLPLCSHFFYRRSPSNLLFPITGCLKTPACKRGMLSPLSVLLWSPRVPLRSLLPNKGLLLVEVTDSFSVSLSLTSSFSFQGHWGREVIEWPNKKW
jgi:hypothetical protein